MDRDPLSYRAEKAHHDYATERAWEANRAARQRAVHNNYDNAREELNRIEATCRAFLDALNDYRSSTYDAKLVREIDLFACDAAGGAIDLLSNLHHEHVKAADEAGLHASDVPFDMSELENLHAQLKERAEARQSDPGKLIALAAETRAA